jgi:hypothetical protein
LPAAPGRIPISLSQFSHKLIVTKAAARQGTAVSPGTP